MAYNKNPFDGMIIFCAIVENEGFGNAARKLGHAPSHISKCLAQLEYRLGARLLNRTTRTLSLTNAGQIFYMQAMQIIGDAELACENIVSNSRLAAGKVRISIPVSLAQSCLNRWLGDFLMKYPDIQLDVEASERMVDLVAEGFDLIIRVGKLSDSQYITRKLATSKSATVASPQYIDRKGKPSSPDDLSDHTIIAFGNPEKPTIWNFSETGKPTIRKFLSPKVKCNSAEMELEMAIAGLGITRLPLFVCQSKLESGELVTVLENYNAAEIDIHAIYPSRENLPLKVRVLIDFLVTRFS